MRKQGENIHLPFRSPKKTKTRLTLTGTKCRRASLVFLLVSGKIAKEPIQRNIR